MIERPTQFFLLSSSFFLPLEKNRAEDFFFLFCVGAFSEYYKRLLLEATFFIGILYSFGKDGFVQ